MRRVVDVEDDQNPRNGVIECDDEGGEREGAALNSGGHEGETTSSMGGTRVRKCGIFQTRCQKKRVRKN